jgi:hypothetical protein
MDRRRSSHIIPEIYEATVNPDHWDYVVTMIAKLTRSKSACLYYKNKEMEFASTIAQHGLSENRSANLGDQCDKLDAMFCAENPGNSDEPSCSQFHLGDNATFETQRIPLCSRRAVC